MKKFVGAPLFAAALIMSFGLSACGGGGGGSSAVSTGGSSNSGGNNNSGGAVATCTASGGATLLSASPTSFSVSSNPSGLVVTLNNGSVTTNAGTTPVTVTPSVLSTTQTLTIDPTGSCYQIQFTVNGSGTAQSISFNKTAYTLAQVNVGTIQSALRSTSSIDTSTVARGPAHFAGSPAVDQANIYVHYSASSLHSSGRSAQSIAASAGARSSMQIAVNGDDVLHAVPVPAGQSVDAFANAMRGQAGVTKVEPAHLRYHATATQIKPNDCHFTPTAPCTATFQQWDMAYIGAPFAWAYFSSNPLSPGAAQSFGTKTAKIAVIDTGYDCNAAANAQRDDLSPNVVFAESILSGVANSSGSPNSPGCSALDTDGHGTNVAGIADALTNNNLGFAGVAANAQLYIYRIFPAGVNQSASTADEAMAIKDAVSRGVNVINLSLGSPASTGPDAGEQAAIQSALTSNVIVVAAAGNDATSSIDYPAGYNGVISVGATSLADGQLNGRGNSNGSATAPVEYIASYSNYGSNLTLVAPGGDPGNNGNDSDNLHWITNLYSLGDTTAGNTCTPSGQPDNICAAKFAGTSQATPHVTGAVALMFAKNPSLTGGQVLQILQSTADDICSAATFACPNGTIMEGKGRLNIYRAMAIVSGDANPPPYKPVVNQFIAFAYNNTFAVGGTPAIINTNFRNGIPIGASGAFQVGDVPTSAQTYKIGVWYNATGTGVVSVGDSFGFVTCSGQTTCSPASNIVVSKVTGGGQTF